MVASPPEGIVVVLIILEPIQVHVPIRQVEVHDTGITTVVAETGKKYAKAICTTTA